MITNYLYVVALFNALYSLILIVITTVSLHKILKFIKNSMMKKINRMPNIIYSTLLITLLLVNVAVIFLLLLDICAQVRN